MEKYHWDEVRQNCHELLRQALLRLSDLTGTSPVYADDENSYSQMAVAPIPSGVDPLKLKSRLYDELRIEIPVTEWNNRIFLRISVQGYNTQEDIDALVRGVEVLLPAKRN